jgi:hypothetical protein
MARIFEGTCLASRQLEGVHLSCQSYLPQSSNNKHRCTEKCLSFCIYKGKQIPLEVWTGPEISRRLKLPDFKTTGTRKWLGGHPYAPAAFTPQEIFLVIISVGALGGAVFEAMRYKPEGRGFDSQWCHWNCSLTYFFQPHYCPEVESACNRNECQEYFLEVKAAGA